MGEPVTTWLVRYEENLKCLVKVGINLEEALPEVVEWQAINMAGLNEDCLERIVDKLLDDQHPMDDWARLNPMHGATTLNDVRGLRQIHTSR